MIKYSIRILQDDEIYDALMLIKLVFDEFEAVEYSSEGIEEFYRFIAYDSIIEDVRTGALKFWGSFDDEQIIGVIAVKRLRHISLLFVDKRYHRRGIAKGLVITAIEYCIKANTQLKVVTVNSSPYGLTSYKAMGFDQVNTEQLINGIRFIPMKYNII